METVIVMPVLLMLIFGIIQFAHIWTARQMVAYAAFCATRAITVVPPDEQEDAAQNAAEVALSWINLADGSKGDEVSIPGWGKIGGSGTSQESDWDGKRVKAVILENGEGKEVAAVEVKFRFPLVIPGMAVNKIIATATQWVEGGTKRALIGDDVPVDFYHDLDTAAGTPIQIDGWPYVVLSETCVLPMPYSTVNFPKKAFEDIKVRSDS